MFVCVCNDETLNQLLGGVTIASGGVPPQRTYVCVRVCVCVCVCVYACVCVWSGRSSDSKHVCVVSGE